MSEKWTEEENNLLKEAYVNEPKDKIVSLLPNRRWMSIQKHASNLNIDRDRNHPTVSGSLNNLKVLLEDTPETYYWIGFLMADGHFESIRGNVKLCIAEKDKDHLIKYSKYVNANYFIWHQRGKDVYECSVSNKLIANEICNKFDISNIKTYNPPDEIKIKNDNLFISFIIGFIDGDGSIGKDGKLQLECHRNWESLLNVSFLRLWELSKARIRINLTGPNGKIPKCILVKGSGFSKGKLYSKMQVGNSDFMLFLKNKTIELNLPVLARKWDRVIKKDSNEIKNIEVQAAMSRLIVGKEIAEREK